MCGLGPLYQWVTDAVGGGHRHRLCQSVMSHSINKHHFISSQTNLSPWLKFLSLLNSGEGNSSARLQCKELWRLRIHKQYCQHTGRQAQWDQVRDLELLCPHAGGLMHLACNDYWTSFKPYAREKHHSCLWSIYGCQMRDHINKK